MCHIGERHIGEYHASVRHTTLSARRGHRLRTPSARYVTIRDLPSRDASSGQVMGDSDIFPVYRPPDWYPLQRVLTVVFGAAAAEAAAAFWFVGFVEGPVDVGELRLYEHSTTRRQIALDRDGGAYRWLDEVRGYIRVDEESALIEALV